MNECSHIDLTCYSTIRSRDKYSVAVEAMRKSADCANSLSEAFRKFVVYVDTAYLPLGQMTLAKRIFSVLNSLIVRVFEG